MPYAAINNMERVFNHPQTHARDMVREMELDAAKSGSISILGIYLLNQVKFGYTNINRTACEVQ